MEGKTEISVRINIRRKNDYSTGQGIDFSESFEYPGESFMDIAKFFSSIHEFFMALAKK